MRVVQSADSRKIQMDKVIRSKDTAALTLEYAMKLPPFLPLFVTEAKAPFSILVANKRYG